MKQLIHEFYAEEKDPLTTFRTILLFGKNVSTYKFALCSALLKLKPQNQIRFSDLSDDFLLFNEHNLQTQKQVLRMKGVF